MLLFQLWIYNLYLSGSLLGQIVQPCEKAGKLLP